MMNPSALATELLDAHRERRLVPAPTSREGGLDLASAYEVEAEIVRIRKATGHHPAGLKVGFANKAAWRILKLETVVWAHMYDDTVRHAADDRAELSVGHLVSPKIEPEIVFCMKGMPASGADAAAVLEAVDWIALGFEIIDCVYPAWQFQPADFIASRGLHAGLVVGTPLAITADNREPLAAALASFTVRLDRNGETAASGGGRNVLRSPAACLGELASALARSCTRGPLQPGELVSSGTLTESQPLAADETWTAEVDGLELPPLTVRTRA
jgi:2-oxo-3-hexenedioate decarboxylase